MSVFTTPDLCDANAHDLQVLAPMLRSFGAIGTFAGQIVTVKCFEDNSKVKTLGGEPGDGKVLVVDGGGSARRALLGDQIALALANNGWAGIIIYGYVRDVAALATTPLGIQALGAIPVKTDKRDIGDVDVPVTFGGVTFTPGHYVYADDNGIVVAARSLLD